ncbi:MAG: tRNA pseudouridine13 synthase, partial [Bradymonadia bacterium]
MQPANPPFEPPLSTPLCDGHGGVVHAIPEHFVVDEIPAYLPSGEGGHWYVRIQKRGLNTQDAVRRIATAAGVERKAMGVAGQKDKHAVTTQWVSLPVDGADPATWPEIEAVTVLEVSRHGNRLKTGHVKGNAFALTFSELPEGWEAAFEATVADIQANKLPNYFGPQRFGTGRRNLDAALKWTETGMRDRSHNARFKNRLYPSVLQSDVFNRYLNVRLADERPLIDGEVVRLDGSKAVFVVEDAAAEVHRLGEGDIHLTGPLFGPKSRAPRGEALVWEVEAVATLGLEPTTKKRLSKSAPGARR